MMSLLENYDAESGGSVPALSGAASLQSGDDSPVSWSLQGFKGTVLGVPTTRSSAITWSVVTLTPAVEYYLTARVNGSSASSVSDLLVEVDRGYGVYEQLGRFTSADVQTGGGFQTWNIGTFTATGASCRVKFSVAAPAVNGSSVFLVDNVDLDVQETSRVHHDPRNRSFDELRNEVARYVQLPDDAETLDLCGEQINDYVGRLNMKGWGWSLKSVDVSLATGTSKYTLPSDFKDIRNIEVLDTSGNGDGFVTILDHATFVSYRVNPWVNEQSWNATFTHSDGDAELELNVIPNSASVARWPTLRVWYYSRVPKYAHPSDHLAIPSEVESFLLWGARANTAAIVDESRYDEARAVRDECYQHLNAMESIQDHRG